MLTTLNLNFKNNKSYFYEEGFKETMKKTYKTEHDIKQLL